MLQQAARMFEQAGAIDAANELRADGERLAALTRTVVSPEVLTSETPFPTLFDIPSFFDEMVCTTGLFITVECRDWLTRTLSFGMMIFQHWARFHSIKMYQSCMLRQIETKLPY